MAWGLGDVAVTAESLGGATPAVPSLADVFYIGFYPLCCWGLVLLLRGEVEDTALDAWMDRAIAGLGLAALFAAFLLDPILTAVGGLSLSSATGMAYPIGDLLLLAIVAGALAVVPRGRRRALVFTAAAMAVNTVGDTYNLLQPDSRAGYVANAIAWPLALLLLCIGVWTQPPANGHSRVARGGSYGLPTLGCVASLLLLAWSSIDHISGGAVVLCTATVFLAGVRMALTVRATLGRQRDPQPGAGPASSGPADRSYRGGRHG